MNHSFFVRIYGSVSDEETEEDFSNMKNVPQEFSTGAVPENNNTTYLGWWRETPKLFILSRL